MSKVKIVILGGYGAFGSLISSELAKSENVTIAGRNREKGQNFANSINADFSLCDAKEGKSLRGTIKGADIVINASGPFYPNDYSIPIICIDNGCHYIDLADGREYVKNFPQLDTMAKTQGVFASTGASTSPAVTYSMISGIPALQEIQSIKIFMNAGNKNEAGISTFASILSYAGQPVQVWNDGHWDEMMGWGSSEKFDFPPPVGRRFVQLCNVPDLELFPNLFEANQVIFKAGVELSILNIGLSILSQVKKHFPIIDLPSITGFLVITSRIFKNFGSFSGSVVTQVTDIHGNIKSLALVTSQNGPRIPTSPAVLLTRKICTGTSLAPGAFPCIGFISLWELRNYLEPFGIKFIAINS